jgi:hypothetical protein
MKQTGSGLSMMFFACATAKNLSMWDAALLTSWIVCQG